MSKESETLLTPAQVVKNLWLSGFFSTARTLNQVAEKLSVGGIHLRLESLRTALKRSSFIIRRGKKGKLIYIQVGPPPSSFKKKRKLMKANGAFVESSRIYSLKKLKSKYDLSRLIKMLIELNDSFDRGNFISVIFLVRSILDHVPPIFGRIKFTEVANNYGTKSFKDVMLHLENSSRKIANLYLHTPVRRKESIPSRAQVNFSPAVDLLLAEIIRIS